MCTLMDLSENRGEAKKAKEISLVLRKEGWDLEKIASTVKYSVDIVKEWIDEDMSA